MSLSAIAEEYFRSMNPLASKIHDDIVEAKNSYETIWETLTEKEKVEIINETLIKPEISLKYALLDTLDFDINDPPVRKDDLMSFFGRDHGQKVIQDENTSYRDEHSAPFLYQTKSQLNLCALSECRAPKEEKPTSPPPVLSELALSHSKVVSELKNALKSHDVLRNYSEERQVTSPGFISKFIGNFKAKDDERECLVSSHQTQIVASSENFFRTNFKSPQNDKKDYRSSVVKSSSDLSEENRGLLSSSQASSGTDFQSTETLTESTSAVPKTGYDFLDNW
ncbi:uncharacterized protein C1orf198 [Manduca sexta]|uniref:DUF4706 domain-containing protein n=1 Tax=Manduca sexta TaxID=7130 RepID=A0A922CR18_MANSE|nr:uncharacterized protein C1orf198 [Manduca sexta]KAG6454668.1 hypothetical protein O3G_MSEX008822 [Manduca sexta]